MSKKSGEQSYKSTMIYPLPATQEETKPLERSRNTTGGQGLRIGLQNMSKDAQHANKQKFSPIRNKHPYTTSPLKKHAPIPGGSHGSDHRAANAERTRCHPYYCRPWMLKSSHIPAMLHPHLGSRSCPTIPQPCLSMVWTP